MDFLLAKHSVHDVLENPFPHTRLVQKIVSKAVVGDFRFSIGFSRSRPKRRSLNRLCIFG
jgi:hypothetical protein